MYMCKVDGETFHYPASGLKNCALLSGTVTNEFNRAGTFSFQIPPNNKCYLEDKFKKLTSEVEVFWDGDRIFRGRILDSNRAYLGQISYKCEGWMSVLNDSIVVPGELTGVTGDDEKGINATPAAMFTALITHHNAQVEAKKQLLIEVHGFANTVVNFPWPSYEKTLDYIQTNFLSNEDIGGWMYVESNTVYLYQDFEEIAVQRIIQGKNLLDLTEAIDAAELYTVIYPLGKEDKTITGATAKAGFPIVGKSIECTDAIAKYGRIVHYESFSDLDTAQKVYDKGQALLASSVDIIPSIDISAVDLSLVDSMQPRFKVGSRIYVVSPLYGIETPYLCTSASIDICNPANSKYTLGRNPDTLTTKQLSMARNMVQADHKYSSEISTKTITATSYPASDPMVRINDITFYRSNKTVYLSFEVTYLRDGSVSAPTIMTYLNDYAPAVTATGTAYDQTTGKTHTLKSTLNVGQIQIFPYEEISAGNIVTGNLTWMMK